MLIQSLLRLFAGVTHTLCTGPRNFIKSMLLQKVLDSRSPDYVVQALKQHCNRRVDESIMGISPF